jgi:hypothetical protein
VTLHKLIADNLRASAGASGRTLGSGHAHELVAAYLGYGSAAALRADGTSAYDDLDEAAVLVPGIALLEARHARILGSAPDAPPPAEVARAITDFLVARGHFSGTAWLERDPADRIREMIDDDPSLILDDVADTMAETNAYFDEVDVGAVTMSRDDDGTLRFGVSGAVSGENDPDRSYFGDRILFGTTVTLHPAAGRIGFAEPEWETGGDVDKSYHDEVDWYDDSDRPADAEPEGA